MKRIYIVGMGLIIGFLGCMQIFIALYYKEDVDNQVIKDKIPLDNELEYIKTKDEDSIDAVYDKMRQEWVDSLLLDDVQKTYGINSLEEYFEKHDSLLRGY